MGIGVDDDLDAVLLGHAQVNVAQVEAVGIGVEFHRDFVFGGGFKYGVDIERDRRRGAAAGVRWDDR